MYFNNFHINSWYIIFKLLCKNFEDISNGNETVSQSEIISLSNLSSKDNYWNLHEEDIKKNKE